eukprot:6380149-Prymnesium_polylepis.2
MHTDGETAPVQLEAGGALQEDVAVPRLGQQPLAHEHHRVVLERRDARPLERRLLEEGIAYLRTRRKLDPLRQRNPNLDSIGTASSPASIAPPTHQSQSRQSSLG